MSVSYLGGHTVITVRRSADDLERRKAHWRKKLAREQREYDAAVRPAAVSSTMLKCPSCKKYYWQGKDHDCRPRSSRHPVR
jgi:uncharacterized protein with PIN domain